MNNTTTPEWDNVGQQSLLNLGVLFLVFILGAIVRHVAELTHIPIPYTVFMFGLGMVAATTPMQDMLHLGPHAMLNVFMPILIFEGAFAMDVYVFRKVVWQALLLAGPGLVVMIAMTAGIAKLLLSTYNWNWNICLLFGSILSATDPVAVVALLKEVGVSKQLSLLIEGESLLNDGTAMVAFAVLFDIIRGETEAGASNIIGVFLRFAVGGPVFGYVIARISTCWLSRTFNDPLSEIAVTLAAAYITFYIGETLLNVSGVLALVTLGITLSNNRTSISPEVENFLHSFWETLAYLANTLIFFLVGLIIARSVFKLVDETDFIYLALIYISVNVIRGITLTLFSPVLAHIGYGLPWQSNVVASWSGLRGAVGLALALIVSDVDDRNLPKNEVGYKILFHLSGVVFLTLVINATTVAKLLALLGMSGISTARRTAMASALKYLTAVKLKTISVWRVDRFLADVDWSVVNNMCHFEDPFSATTTPEEEDIILRTSRWGVCPECNALVPYQPTEKEMTDLTNDAIKRYIKAEKLSYWRQFEKGLLTRQAIRILMELCEIAADNKGRLVDLEEIKKTWKRTFWTKMLSFLEKQDMTATEDLPDSVNVADVDVFPLKMKTARRFSYSRRPAGLKGFVTHPLLVAVMAVSLFFVIDVPIVILALMVEIYGFPDSSWTNFMIPNIILLFLIAVYCLVRVLVLKKVYVKSVWFGFSVAFIVIGVVDIALHFALPPGDKENTIVRQVFILLRFIRLLHALEALMPALILLLEKMVQKTLSSGYDVGRGFVLGEDEIRSLVDHMSDYTNITDSLRSHCDDAKLEILKALGLVQKQYPEVAMSVKTRQAIRSVLNDLRQCIHTLQQEGVLEEMEGKELEGKIETKMKRLLTAPPRVPLPSIEKILQNVPWIENNSALVNFIKSRAKLINYVYGQTLMEQGEETSGILIILSGMVKLELQLDEGTKILDFLTSGNVLGEMGVLTNKRRTATVKSETAVLVLDLSKKDVDEAFEMFRDMNPPLKTRLWRLMAIRLSTGLFMDLPAFQGMTKERIRLKLESGYIHEIEDTGRGFTIHSSMADVVLVHGVAFDSFTQEEFNGPCYIPLSVMKLKFKPNQSPNPVLFILPGELPIYRDTAILEASPEIHRRMKAKTDSALFVQTSGSRIGEFSRHMHPSSSRYSGFNQPRKNIMLNIGNAGIQSTHVSKALLRSPEPNSVQEATSMVNMGNRLPGSAVNLKKKTASFETGARHESRQATAFSKPETAVDTSTSGGGAEVAAANDSVSGKRRGMKKPRVFPILPTLVDEPHDSALHVAMHAENTTSSLPPVVLVAAAPTVHEETWDSASHRVHSDTTLERMRTKKVNEDTAVYSSEAMCSMEALARGVSPTLVSVSSRSHSPVRGMEDRMEDRPPSRAGDEDRGAFTGGFQQTAARPGKVSDPTMPERSDDEPRRAADVTGPDDDVTRTSGDKRSGRTGTDAVKTQDTSQPAISDTADAKPSQSSDSLTSHSMKFSQRCENKPSHILNANRSKSIDTHLSLGNDTQPLQSSDSKLLQCLDTGVSKRSYTNLLQSSDTKISQSSNATLLHGSDTKLSHNSDTKLSRSSRRKLSHSSDTKLSQSSDTKFLHDSATKLSRSSHTKVSQSSDTRVSQSSDTNLSHSSDIKLLHDSDTKFLHDSDTKLSQSSRRKLSQSSDTKLLHDYDSKLLQSSDTKVSHSSEIKLSQSSVTKPLRNTDIQSSQIFYVKASHRFDTEASQSSDTKLLHRSETQPSQMPDSKPSERFNANSPQSVHSEASESSDGNHPENSGTNHLPSSFSKAVTNSDNEDSQISGDVPAHSFKACHLQNRDRGLRQNSEETSTTLKDRLPQTSDEAFSLAPFDGPCLKSDTTVSKSLDGKVPKTAESIVPKPSEDTSPKSSDSTVVKTSQTKAPVVSSATVSEMSDAKIPKASDGKTGELSDTTILKHTDARLPKSLDVLDSRDSDTIISKASDVNVLKPSDTTFLKEADSSVQKPSDTTIPKVLGVKVQKPTSTAVLKQPETSDDECHQNMQTSISRVSFAGLQQTSDGKPTRASDATHSNTPVASDVTRCPMTSLQASDAKLPQTSCVTGAVVDGAKPVAAVTDVVSDGTETKTHRTSTARERSSIASTTARAFAADTAQTAGDTTQVEDDTPQTAAGTPRTASDILCRTADISIADTCTSAPDTSHTATDTPHPAADLARTAADTPRAVADTQHTTAYTPRTVTETRHTIADTPRTVTETRHTIADTSRTVTETRHTIADTPRTVTETRHTIADTPRTVTETRHTTIDKPLTVVDTRHTTDVPYIIADTRHTTPDIPHAVADTRHTADDILRTVADTLHAAADVPRAMADTRHTTPDTRHEVADTRHTTPDIPHAVADTRHTADDILRTVADTLHAAADVPRAMADTRHTTPDTRHEVADTRHTTPDTPHTVVDTWHALADVPYIIAGTRHTTADTPRTVADTGHATADTRQTTDGTPSTTVVTCGTHSTTDGMPGTEHREIAPRSLHGLRWSAHGSWAATSEADGRCGKCNKTHPSHWDCSDVTESTDF